MSCRTGRMPMVNDPLIGAHGISGVKTAFNQSVFFQTIFTWWLYKKYHHKHHYQTYKGPENPFARIRHRRMPAGAICFGWGNNGINRDCSLREWECWSGYTGKEYTY